MPFIPERLRDCVVYLYPSVEAAQHGKHAGGTGFLVGVPSPVDSLTHLYAVTNEHVIRPPSGSPSAVIRLNNADGTTEILDHAADEWQSHPSGDDIAITQLILGSGHRFSWIDQGEFITSADIERYHIGPGDDCFMIGRFIYQDGRQRNEPVLRFGNIAMMPQPIRQPDRNRDQDSFLVEMRSLSGFSGAPVMVHYVTVGTRAQPDPQIDGGVAYSSLVTNKAWLLGVDWGSVPSIPNLLGDQTDRSQMPSGMAAVVPAWKITELLNIDEFVAARREG